MVDTSAHYTLKKLKDINMIPTLVSYAQSEGFPIPGSGTIDPALNQIYGTLTAAAAASPDTSVTWLITQGRNTPGDGGHAFWVYVVTPITTAVITCANGRKYQLAVDIANVKIFGAMGDQGPDSSPGFQQAIDYGELFKKPVYAPGGIYHFYNHITVGYSEFEFYGDGPLTKLRCVNMTTQLFKFEVGGRTLNYMRIHDFSPECYIDTPSLPNTCAAFRVVSTVPGVHDGMGQCEFYNIRPKGFPVAFQSDAQWHGTDFGKEGPCSWNKFYNWDIQHFSKQPLYGFIFNTGSGTGNSFKSIGGVIDQSVWLYSGGAPGSNYVVGDISIEDMDQWGSYNTTTSALLTIGDNTVYRSRITLTGGQADAGLSRLIVFSNVGSVGYNEVKIDVVRGGGCVVGPHPVLLNSRIEGSAKGTIPAA
jgi:hypothetical protein